MSTQKYSYAGAGALVAAAFLYAMFGVLIRTMSEMWGNNAQVASRFLIALVLLSVYLALRKHRVRLPKEKRPRVMLLGVTFVLVVLFFTVSVQHTSLANSVFTTYAASIVSSFLIGTLILKEKLTPIRLLAIVLSLIGISFYAHALLTLSLGVVTGLACGLFDGISNSLRKTLVGLDRNAVLRLQYAVATMIAVVVTAASGETIIKDVTFAGVIVTLVFGILLVTLGNLLLYGFHHIDVNVGTVILTMELVFAIILGYLLYREVPVWNELVGGIFIFAAAILSSVDVKNLFKRKKLAAVR